MAERARLEPEVFREIMASFPSGVVVLTALGEDGMPCGLTVSAFCPVSLEPPLALVCVDRTSNTLAAIRASGFFTINILSAREQELARRMATKALDKFSALEWSEAPVPGAGPILSGRVAAFAACSVEKEIPAGDHLIFIGRVLAGGVEPARTPLVYHRRAFLELGG